jgi:hypothetical protein
MSNSEYDSSDNNSDDEIEILNKVLRDTKQKITKKKLDLKKNENSEKIKNEKRLYEDVKAHFEKNHFMLCNPVCYIKYDTVTNELYRKSKQDFSNTYEDLYYEGLNKKGDLCKQEFLKRWYKDENKRKYDFIDFLPQQKAPPNVFNTFKQFEVESLTRQHNENFIFTSDPFDEHEIIKKSYIYNHLQNLCGNNNDVFEYVLMWLSRLVSKPHDITKTSLIFKSTQGTGKDLFFDWFGNNILGSNYYHNEEKPELIFGKFNGVIHNKVLIVLNEASGKDNRQINENIKMAITRSTNTIEFKGKDAFKNTNCIGYVFLTNNDNPINISCEDRRFVAIKCNNNYANNAEYFKKLIDEMNSKKMNRYFYDYLKYLSYNKYDEVNNITFVGSDNYDFTGKRPITDYYDDIKELNKSALIYFLEDLIFKNYRFDTEGDRIFLFTPTEIFTKFKSFIDENGFKYEISNVKFSFELKKFENSITKERSSTSRKIIIDIKKLYEEMLLKKLIKPIDGIKI